MHAVVLKPYAYPDPDRVLLTFSMFRGNRGSWSVGNYNYFDQRLTTTHISLRPRGASFNLSDEGQPERVVGRRVTWNFFPMFGIAPAHGRTFTADEDRPGTGERRGAERSTVAAALQRRSHRSSADRSG